MTPSLLGLVSAALLAALWLAGRRRSRPILRSCDTSAVAALNRAQLALLEDRPFAAADSGAAAPLAVLPADRGPRLSGLVAQAQQLQQGPLLLRPARRLALRRQLLAAARGGDLERLEAMTAAALWPDPALLPLLRRGLRDPNPGVMRQAALAMQAFRGRPLAADVAPHQLAPSLLAAPSLPRNAAPRRVSRTR